MKIKPYPETHMKGIIDIYDFNTQVKEVDVGIRIAEDGRIWICIDGIAFFRFKPTNQYVTIEGKLRGPNEL